MKRYPCYKANWKFGNLKLGSISIKQYKIIIFHIGTTPFLTKHLLLSKLVRIINLVHKLNKNAFIGISVLLPRPCATEIRNRELIEQNKLLKKFCHSVKIRFIPSFRRFIDNKTKTINKIYAPEIKYN